MTIAAFRGHGPERRRARRLKLLCLLAAAAVLVAAVGVIGIAQSPRGTGDTTQPSPGGSGPAQGATPADTPTPSASGTPASSSDLPSPSGSILSTLPPPADLLAAAGRGAVLLQSLEGDAASRDEIVPFGLVPHRGALAVVVACAGGDSIGLAISASELPATDAGGSESPFSERPACDGTVQADVSWDGWNSVILNAGARAALSVPAGIAYRAVLVDTSLVPADGGQTAVTNGLPTIAHLSEARSDVGLIIATHERLSAAGDRGSEAQAADIRPSRAIRVLIACTGGSASLAVATLDLPSGNGFSTEYSELGSPICDGTIQAFDWARTEGATNEARVMVNAAPGTSWRTVVRDMTGGTHPRPTVPCGSTAGLKWAPRPTLFESGKAVGSLPGYFSSVWGTSADDGVPVVPATALHVTAGKRLQLRIAGDACATAWSVVYGTPAAGGIGIDPVGALALLNEYPTTVASRENRIDLASLPPGDWVLEVNLAFDKGGGVGLLRVHAVAPGFTFDVQNRSSIGVVVSAVGDAGGAMSGFEPGQSGTVVVPLANPQNGIHLEIQGEGCKVVASADYATSGPLTLIIADGAQPGTIRLSTLATVSATPIPLPTNDLVGCGG